MNEFNLDGIADRLEAMEECIISKIFDRIQYKLNAAVYPESLDYMHLSIEKILAGMGKFNPVEEKPFFRDSVSLVNGDAVNLTAQIKKAWTDFIEIACEPGDDKEYGSTAETDIAALTAISKRIHYGSFYVAQSKYLINPQAYTDAVRNNDKDAVMRLLTRRDKEAQIISRVEEKCEKIQSAYTSKLRKKINPQKIGRFYENTVIPLTKEGETQYLFMRCKNEI